MGLYSRQMVESTYKNWRAPMTGSLPIIEPKPDSLLQRLNAFIDKFLLPYPVMFLTNRVIILATLALLVPLLFFTSNQAFVNSLNSYLNVMSVVVSSTVLLYATIADVRDRAAAKQAEGIAKAYERLLEERVQEREEIAKAYEQLLEGRVQEREAIAKAYEQLLEGRVQEREEIASAYAEELEKRVQGREEIVAAYAEELEKRVQGREEIATAYAEELEKRVQADHELIEQILKNSIENILGGQLEKIRVEDHRRLDDMQKAVIASNEVLRSELAEKAAIASNEALGKELAELKELVQQLYQSQFGNPSSPDS
jgi:hypothetical protein